jgi:hypothetical protein
MNASNRLMCADRLADALRCIVYYSECASGSCSSSRGLAQAVCVLDIPSNGTSRVNRPAGNCITQPGGHGTSCPTPPLVQP